MLLVDGLLKLFSIQHRFFPDMQMSNDPDLVGDTKGPPTKRARPDTPLETQSTDPGGKLTFLTYHNTDCSDNNLCLNLRIYLPFACHMNIGHEL